MSKQIIINTDSQKTRIAIVEDGDLAELFIETEEHERTLGNLVVGRVRRIMPSIQAAFVDIGQKQDAFLHFSDLGDNLADWLAYLGEQTPEIGVFKPQHQSTHKGRKRRRPLHGRPHGEEVEEEEDDDLELDEDVVDQDGDDESDEGDESGRHAIPGARLRGRRRSMQRRVPAGRAEEDEEDEESDGPPVHTLLQRDQAILVKISKEPIAQKGSRISTDISLAGRFLVLVPMANYVAVSKKIASFKERRRLRILAKSLLPDGFGVIVRTVAQDQTAKTLDTDLRLLVERWKKIEAKLATHPKPPSVVYEDVNMVSSVIRDLFSDNYDKIVVDNPRLYRNVKSYIQAVAPDMAVSVQLHQSDVPVFRAAGIERKVAEAFERRINLPSGAYLFFEQTEAMHVIDVNSGRAGKGMSQEESSLKVNLEAARAIAKQMRLRDLGGIVVVDFIDLRHERNRRKVLEELKKEFRKDRAVTKLLPMSDFGIIQITRQRLRPSITTTFSDLHGQAPAPGVESPSSSSEPAAHRVSLPAMHMADAATPESLIGDFEDWIRAYRRAGFNAPVRLRVHPFVAAFLNRRLPSQSFRWMVRFRQRVRIEADTDCDVVTWQMLDLETGEDVTRVPVRRPAPRFEAPAPSPEPESDRESDRESRRGGRRRGGRDRRGRRDGDGREGRRQEQGDRRGGGRGDDRSSDRGQDRGQERVPERRDTRPGDRREEQGAGRRDDERRGQRDARPERRQGPPPSSGGRGQQQPHRPERGRVADEGVPSATGAPPPEVPPVVPAREPVEAPSAQTARLPREKATGSGRTPRPARIDLTGRARPESAAGSVPVPGAGAEPAHSDEPARAEHAETPGDPAAVDAGARGRGRGRRGSSRAKPVADAGSPAGTPDVTEPGLADTAPDGAADVEEAGDETRARRTRRRGGRGRGGRGRKGDGTAPGEDASDGGPGPDAGTDPG